MMKLHLKVLQPSDRCRDCSSGEPCHVCIRCGLDFSYPRSDPTDRRYCDRLCPVWGTHGDLWIPGDEESAREALSIALRDEQSFESLIDDMLFEARIEDMLLEARASRTNGGAT